MPTNPQIRPVLATAVTGSTEPLTRNDRERKDPTIVSRLNRRQVEALQRVADTTEVVERDRTERSRAIDDALAAGCAVKHVAILAKESRQSLYRNHNAAATGARARRQEVEHLREQAVADTVGERTKTDCADIATDASKDPTLVEERDSASPTCPIDGEHESPGTTIERPPASQQHPPRSAQPGPRIPPGRVKGRGPTLWPHDAPKLGSNTANSSRPSSATPDTTEPNDSTAGRSTPADATPGTTEPNDSTAGRSTPADATPGTTEPNDGLATFLPADPWGGPQHAAELASAVGAALVFAPRCSAQVQYHRLHGGGEAWMRDAAVLRYLLSIPEERKEFEIWFKSEPIAEDDRTTDEQNSIWYFEHKFRDVLQRMRPEDLSSWRGRVVTFLRDPRRYGRYLASI